MLRGWPAHLAVFASSACALALELVAGRMLAPYLSVSLYTWTSAIGVVLAGVSLGSFAGGWAADRWRSPRLLGLVLLAGGLACLLVLPLASLPADRMRFRLPCGPDFGGSFEATCSPLLVTLTRIVALTAAIFLLPSLLLGMVAPIAIRLALPHLATSGRTVGALYASATLGSLVGTFLAGFWLISALGTRAIVLGAGLLLLLLAVCLGRLWRIERVAQGLPLLAGAALLVLLLQGVRDRRALESGCYRETDYFCIKVYDQPVERDLTLRVLTLDHLVHSYNDLADPTYYEYSYLRVYAELTDYVARQRPAFRALFIGGGGYTLPRGLEVEYPAAELEVIEIDPGVTRTAYERLGLPADTRVVTHNLDARLIVERLQGGLKYDLIYGDAFNDLSVPYHLTTLEFDQRIRALLRDDGLYLVNVIDRFRGGRFLAAMTRTLGRVFPHVYLLSAGQPWLYLVDSPRTYVVAASASPLDPARLGQVQPQGLGGRVWTNVMPTELLERWLDETPGPLLTDDFAPADNLIAPLFAERGL